MKTYSHIIILILGFLLLGCGSKKREISIDLEIKVFLSKNDTIYFKFGDFFDSNYDKFLILIPYSNIDLMGKKLDVNLDKVKKTRIERRDDICVLCMFQNNILMEYKILNIYPINWTPMNWSTIEDIKFIDKDTELSIVKNRDRYCLVFPR